MWREKEGWEGERESRREGVRRAGWGREREREKEREASDIESIRE